jgi:A/G-specific adenine glycosylase
MQPFPFLSLVTWYRLYGREFPWRQVYDLPAKDRLYRIWVSEVMLQQTQAERVCAYYLRFLERYPTMEILAETSYEELFPFWQGLGYYSRARRMIQVARDVITHHDGIFPADYETLRGLPGIGEYTAHALLAFGYDRPVLAMDANLRKIFTRYYHGSRYISLTDEELENLSIQAHSSISGRDLNNALMDFWAWTMRWRDELISSYPLPVCLWYRTRGWQEQAPRKNIQKVSKQSKLLVFLHENHQKYISSRDHVFEPFLLESIGSNDRHTIQDYFLVTYGLQVSVRPYFGVGQYGDLVVRMFYAQVQSGTVALTTYSQQEQRDWMDTKISWKW